MSDKRISFTMDEQCAALLKSICALKGVSVSDYCYQLIREDFIKDVYEDGRIRELFMRGTYRPGSNAQALQEQVQQHTFE